MRGSPTAKGAAGTLVKEGLRLTIGLRAQPQQQAPASGKPQILSHRLGVVGATGSASALGLQKGVTDAQTGWQDPALLQSQWRAGVPWASLTVHCSPWATHGPLLPGLWGPSGCRKGQKRELQQQPCLINFPSSPSPWVSWRHSGKRTFLNLCFLRPGT